jgi:hypothetical protein
MVVWGELESCRVLIALSYSGQSLDRIRFPPARGPARRIDLDVVHMFQGLNVKPLKWIRLGYELLFRPVDLKSRDHREDKDFHFCFPFIGPPNKERPMNVFVKSRSLFSNGEIGCDCPRAKRYSDQQQNNDRVVNAICFHCIFSPSLVLTSESQIQTPLAGIPLFLSAFWIGRS